MKIYIKGSFLFTAIHLAFALVVTWISLGIKGMAGFVPLVFGIGSSILAMLLLFGERYPRLISRFDINMTGYEKKSKPLEHRLQLTAEQSPDKKVVVVLAYLLVFYVLIYLVGIIMATPIFILASLKIYGRINWVPAISITTIVAGFIYVIFEVLLGLDLFRGILFGEIVPPL